MGKCWIIFSICGVKCEWIVLCVSSYVIVMLIVVFVIRLVG